MHHIHRTLLALTLTAFLVPVAGADHGPGHPHEVGGGMKCEKCVKRGGMPREAAGDMENLSASGPEREACAKGKREAGGCGCPEHTALHARIDQLEKRLDLMQMVLERGR